MASGSSEGIELSDLIWQLRHDLSRAMWAGEHTDLRFEAGPIQLEVTVAAERSHTPGAKVRLFVVDAEAGLRRTSTVSQKITMPLPPRRADAPHEPPMISGSDVPDER